MPPINLRLPSMDTHLNESKQKTTHTHTHTYIYILPSAWPNYPLVSLFLADLIKLTSATSLNKILKLKTTNGYRNYMHKDANHWPDR